MRRVARGRAPRTVPILVALAVVGAVTPVPTAGQDLARIEALATDGRAADARDSLLAWWDAEWDAAPRSEREHALWLRGVLTLDPAEASATYRRMVTEFPAGDRTDRALHRLASLAAAVGDSATAARWFRILERDYPDSRLGGDRITRPVGTPGAQPTPGTSSSATGAASAGPAETDPGRAEPREAPAASGDWTVQLGAFAAESTAREIAAEARDAGFEIRVVLVEGSDLWRVRSGRFPEADGARPLLARMLSAGLAAAIVPGAERETSGG